MCQPPRATDPAQPSAFCNCGRRFAYMEDGLLVIWSAHNHEQHRNRLTLAEVLDLFAADGVPVPALVKGGPDATRQ